MCLIYGLLQLFTPDNSLRFWNMRLADLFSIYSTIQETFKTYSTSWIILFRMFSCRSGIYDLDVKYELYKLQSFQIYVFIMKLCDVTALLVHSVGKWPWVLDMLNHFIQKYVYHSLLFSSKSSVTQCCLRSLF